MFNGFIPYEAPNVGQAIGLFAPGFNCCYARLFANKDPRSTY